MDLITALEAQTRSASFLELPFSQLECQVDLPREKTASDKQTRPQTTPLQTRKLTHSQVADDTTAPGFDTLTRNDSPPQSKGKSSCGEIHEQTVQPCQCAADSSPSCVSGVASDPTNLGHRERKTCSYILPKGSPCRLGVKAQSHLSNSHCKRHLNMQLQDSTGFYTRKGGDNEWIDFSDWIPPHLDLDTQVALRIKMATLPSRSDKNGYIYTYEIRDPETRQTQLKFKVGKAVILAQRLQDWSNKCNEHEHYCRGFWPGTVENPEAHPILLPGHIRSGEPGPLYSRVEDLVHLELADLAQYKAYLNHSYAGTDPKSSSPGEDKWAGEDEITKQLRASRMSSKSWAQIINREACKTCYGFHYEIFSFDRFKDGRFKGREWEDIVMPVIQKWGRFVRYLYDPPSNSRPSRNDQSVQTIDDTDTRTLGLFDAIIPAASFQKAPSVNPLPNWPAKRLFVPEQPSGASSSRVSASGSIEPRHTSSTTNAPVSSLTLDVQLSPSSDELFFSGFSNTAGGILPISQNTGDGNVVTPTETAGFTSKHLKVEEMPFHFNPNHLSSIRLTNFESREASTEAPRNYDSDYWESAELTARYDLHDVFENLCAKSEALVSRLDGLGGTKVEPPPGAQHLTEDTNANVSGASTTREAASPFTQSPSASIFPDYLLAPAARNIAGARISVTTGAAPPLNMGPIEVKLPRPMMISKFANEESKEESEQEVNTYDEESEDSSVANMRNMRDFMLYVRALGAAYRC